MANKIFFRLLGCVSVFSAGYMLKAHLGYGEISDYLSVVFTGLLGVVFVFMEFDHKIKNK